jgi:hypothetical protein
MDGKKQKNLRKNGEKLDTGIKIRVDWGYVL